MASDSSASQIGHVSFAAYISDLSSSNRWLRSLTVTEESEEESTGRAGLPVVEFSLLLNQLRVPGPCFPIFDSKVIGSGAQFVVRKGQIGFFQKPVAGLFMVAIKSPKFMLDSKERVDLFAATTRRQVFDMVVELAALYHPNLRRHKNIVDIVGWGVDETWHKVPFLALELADGDLRALMSSQADLSFGVRRSLISDIASALDAIHEIGIVHADLTPGNVLVFEKDSVWTAKLSDFGGGAGLISGNVVRGRGTVGWRAPELRRYHDDGEPLGLDFLRGIDVYPFGLLSWFILCQSACPPRGSEEETALQSALEDLQLQEDIPETPKASYHSLFQECLCGNPEGRPKNISSRLPGRQQNTVNINAILEQVTNLDVNDKKDNENNLADDSSDASFDFWRMGWEIPDIDLELSSHLLFAFAEDNEVLPPETAFGLFLKWEHYKADELGEPGMTDIWLRVLRTAALGGVPQAQSLIFLCYEYHSVEPDDALEAYRSDWSYDSIAMGALAFSEAFRLKDPSAFDDALAEFQESGGYNQDYSNMDPGALRNYLDLDKQAVLPGVSAEEPLNKLSDNLIHILCSFRHPAAFTVLKTFGTAGKVNALNQYDQSPLYRACSCGAFETAVLLLDLGADPTLRPYGQGPTCLHWLIAFHPDEISEVADQIVNRGAHLNAIISYFDKMLHYPFGITAGAPLHWAVEFSSKEAVQALLRHGADPWLPDGVRQFIFATNTPDNWPESIEDILHEEFILGPSCGPSPVELAVQNWDHSILRLLLDHSPQRLREDSMDGIGTFHHLIAGEFRWISDTTRFYNPMVRGGAETRRVKIQDTIRTLESYGHDINSLAAAWRDGTTSTCLMLAIHAGNLEVAEALLEAGADVNTQGSDGRTAIMYLGSKYSDGYTGEHDIQKRFQVRTTKLLLSYGARLDVRDKRGRSPILALAGERLVNAVEVLLEHGADASDRFASSSSTWEQEEFPMFAMLAREAGYSEEENELQDRELASMLRRYLVPLLERDKTSGSRPTGRTLLHRTAYLSLIESARVLLDAGADINAVYQGVFDEGTTMRRAPMTPLDEVLNWRPLTIQGAHRHLPKSDVAKREARFDTMEKLLRSRGAFRATELEATREVDSQ
ncbi:hypothetical protein ACJ41O_014500 [Fusarium nematophilum]